MGKPMNQKRADLENARAELHRAQLATALVEVKRAEQSEVLSLLDQLRRTRKDRGGVGAPLQVPAHLRDAAEGQGIIITDADLTIGSNKPVSGE